MVPLNDPTEEDLRNARANLDDIAECVTWQLNYEMQASLGRLGITRMVDKPLPWSEIAPQEIIENDEVLQKQGLTRRLVIIGIMGEYLEGLRQWSPRTEPHIRARFLAAITMAHEVVHAVFHQEFRSLDYEPISGYEPYVGDNSWAELGFSFIAWILSGFNPTKAFVGNYDVAWSFDVPFCWELQP